MAAVEAGPRGGAGDQSAVGNGCGERGELAPFLENVGGVAGPHLGIVALGIGARGDERKVAQAHILHGPADRADVGGIERVDQHDAYVFESHDGATTTAKRRGAQAKAWRVTLEPARPRAGTGPSRLHLCSRGALPPRDKNDPTKRGGYSQLKHGLARGGGGCIVRVPVNTGEKGERI